MQPSSEPASERSDPLDEERKGQEDRRSCLLALVRAARTHGVHLSVDQLQRDYALGSDEPGMALLAKIASDNGLEARWTRLSWKHLSKMDNGKPLILRMGNGQAVLFVGCRMDDRTPAALLADPCRAPDDAAIAVDEVRLSGVWNGDALFLKRRRGASEEEKPFGFAWLVDQVLRERAIFKSVGIAALMLSVFSIIPPLVMMTVTDQVLVHQRISTLYVLTFGVMFILFFDTVFNYMRQHLVIRGAAKIDARLSLYVFDKLIGLPIDFFERNATGTISYKLNEIWRVRNFLTGQLFGTALDFLTLFILIPTMFVLNAPLSLFVLGIALVMCAVVAVYIPPMSRAHGRVIAAEQRKGSFQIEVIHGMRTVKSLALEGRKRVDWDACVAEAVKANVAFQDIGKQPQVILGFLQKLTYFGPLTLGAGMAVADETAMYAGVLIAFTMIANRAVNPLVGIANMLQQIHEIRGAVAQVASVVNLQPESDRNVQGVRPLIRGAIDFSEVSFLYPGSRTPALSDISVSLPQGAVVGVMGRSGSGKTTITRLLQGLHRNYDGIIKIDGVDLREIDLNHLRSNIGVVLQDSFLFRGTIRENIMAARMEAGLEDVMQAARLAGAEEFIERLPKGYETMIEEGAANLSGGQRQRLAIARALLTDPAILIFDEATSALDPDSEAIINSNLLRIAHGRTVIVISHRLASLVNCDQILVLEKGRLHDVGRHEELLDSCDVYRHLWMQQNRHMGAGNTNERNVFKSANRN
jgi:ATP-binding cassette, subfamily B, bacterial HlyB/CyaB